ncbi:XRE family transcriptional regulator [Aeromicrobium piscarium]|uniref:XRE family transcriptional regulator n=1 Tax=Aeromicrobium piscarium TaxID=2590901 RepID=A0A554S8Z3_9ACTN|nr:XRE family transcriptional regulator [Aeromicrobium piscarium]TSD62817.1 XRE family transcriptional regulator [Aeromicrobium piscarium]
MSPQFREAVNWAIASEVRRARDAQEVTEDQLVEWSGIDAGNMAEGLDGIDGFTVTDLVAIESALNLPVGYLIEQALNIVRTITPAGVA